MHFKNIEISDKKNFDEILIKNELYSCSNYEANFQTLFCFGQDLKIQVAYDELGIYISHFEDSFTKFYPPITKTKEDFVTAVERLDDYSRSINEKFVIEGLTNKQMELLENTCPRFYSFSADRNNFEYLYKPQKFIDYSEEFQKFKIDQVKGFEKRVSANFRPYAPEDYDKVIDLFDEWLKNRRISEYDYNPMKRALKHYDELGLKAAVLDFDGKLIGISITAIERNNVGILLFEKADHKYFGSNTALVHYFARDYLKDVNFVNRQEDMGIFGLRISKLSYLADKFIDKYVLTRGFTY